MGAQVVRPRTLEERIVYWTIVSTWGIWLLGGLYLVGSVLGYVLLVILALRAAGVVAPADEPIASPPWTVLVWVGGMFAMLVALVFAHVDFDLGLPLMLKSIFGWVKGWALFAVFPLIGSSMSIRPQVLSRAMYLLAAQTLAIAPFLFAAQIAGLPQSLYVSPLHSLIGSGPEFFDVTLYSYDETNGKPRWRFFAPWATASALLAGLSVYFTGQERPLLHKSLGIVCAVLVCWMAGSRLSIVVLPAVLLMTLVLSNLTRPAMWGVVACVAVICILMSQDVVHAIEDATEAFNNARAASSRVRTALGNIAVHRWLTEAPLFGHGALERGGHVVERMLIGSHHTWWGLLFVKGAVGFAALAVPMTTTIAALVLRAQSDRVAQCALAMLLSMLLFSLGDNLEIVAYIIWPSLILIGIALKSPIGNPFAERSRPA